MRTVLSALSAPWRSSRTTIGLAVFRVLILVTPTSVGLALEACVSGVWQALSHTPTAHLATTASPDMPGRTGHVLCALMGRHRVRSAHRACCVRLVLRAVAASVHSVRQGDSQTKITPHARSVRKAHVAQVVVASSANQASSQTRSKPHAMNVKSGTLVQEASAVFVTWATNQMTNEQLVYRAVTAHLALSLASAVAVVQEQK